MRQANERLAAHAHIRQVSVHNRADVAANAAERAIRVAWNQLLRMIQAGRADVAILLLDEIRYAPMRTILGHLKSLVKWGHASAVKAVKASVPLGSIKRKVKDGSQLGESRLVIDDRRLSAVGDISEALTLTDILAFFRGDEPPDQDIWSLLFPAFTPEQVDRVVFSGNWRDRITAGTKLGDPGELARIISAGLTFGKTHQEIARDLKPHVQGVVASARRVARTECMRVAQDVQMQAHKQLGGLIIGWQVLATLDQHSRPWHAHRNGQVYYLNPKPGQKGMKQRPTPPDEPMDPAERPPGTSRTAWNCRCTLLPVLSDPSEEVLPQSARKVLSDNASSVVPDTLTMGQWFSRAPLRDQKTLVGVKRYNELKAQLGERPSWAHFIDASGQLLPLDRLSNETARQRTVRVETVRKQLAQRKTAQAQLVTFGFIPGKRNNS